jgi:hypothetical protein
MRRLGGVRPDRRATSDAGRSSCERGAISVSPTPEAIRWCSVRSSMSRRRPRAPPSPQRDRAAPPPRGRGAHGRGRPAAGLAVDLLALGDLAGVPVHQGLELACSLGGFRHRAHDEHRQDGRAARGVDELFGAGDPDQRVADADVVVAGAATLAEVGNGFSKNDARARLALSKAEVAEALGCSVDFLEEHVLPELRVVRRGRRVFIALAELERWLERSAALTLEGR